MGLTADSDVPDRTTPDTRAVSGVVWDFGNVLIDWDPVAAVAAGMGADEAKRFFEAEDFDFDTFNRGPDAGTHTWAEAIEEVRRHHPHWTEHAAAYHRHFRASILHPVPGTPELLRRLHAAGVPQWGLTNWSHELYPEAPAQHEVLRLLDGVVVSGTERVAKPDPAIYRRLEERSGIPLTRLVLVDDTQANVAAAAELGMDAIRFTDAASLCSAFRTRGLPV